MDKLETDLSLYKGREIIGMDAFDSKGKEVSLPTDESISIDDFGRPKFSSYFSGIVEWVEKENAYVKWYHNTRTVLDIAGFCNIEVDEE